MKASHRKEFQTKEFFCHFQTARTIQRKKSCVVHVCNSHGRNMKTKDRFEMCDVKEKKFWVKFNRHSLCCLFFFCLFCLPLSLSPSPGCCYCFLFCFVFIVWFIGCEYAHAYFPHIYIWAICVCLCVCTVHVLHSFSVVYLSIYVCISTSHNDGLEMTVNARKTVCVNWAARRESKQNYICRIQFIPRHVPNVLSVSLLVRPSLSHFVLVIWNPFWLSVLFHLLSISNSSLYRSNISIIIQHFDFIAISKNPYNVCVPIDMTYWHCHRKSEFSAHFEKRKKREKYDDNNITTLQAFHMSLHALMHQQTSERAVIHWVYCCICYIEIFDDAIVCSASEEQHEIKYYIYIPVFTIHSFGGRNVFKITYNIICMCLEYRWDKLLAFGSVYWIRVKSHSFSHTHPQRRKHKMD